MKVIASSPPVTATTRGRACTNNFMPPGWRAITAMKAPRAKPSSLKGVRTMVAHQLTPMSNPIKRASIAHSEVAKLTAMSARGRVDVDAVEPCPGLTVQQVVERRPPQQRDQRGHKEDQRQHAVVEREDAQDAPYVEIAKVVRLVARVVEDAGDEKTGQDEEQIDTEESVLGDADDGALDPIAGQHLADEVEHQDHQDGQAPDPVERRQVPTQAQRRSGTRHGRRAQRWCCAWTRGRDHGSLFADRASLSEPPARARPRCGPATTGPRRIGASMPGWEGCQYRPISAATIKNSSHNVSVPRIQVVSRTLVSTTKRARLSRSHARAGARSATRQMAWKVTVMKTTSKIRPMYPISSCVSK